jgi:hypothetical protein
MNKEKQYLIFKDNKTIFADCKEDLIKYTKNLKSYEYTIYKRC